MEVYGEIQQTEIFGRIGQEIGMDRGRITKVVLYINFRSPFPRRLHIKFGFDWLSGFRGEDVRNCGRTMTRRRTMGIL